MFIVSPPSLSGIFSCVVKKLGGKALWLALLAALLFSLSYSPQMKAQPIEQYCAPENDPCTDEWVTYSEYVTVMLPGLGSNPPCPITVKIFYARHCNSIKILDADYQWTTNPPDCYDPDFFGNDLASWILGGAINPLLTAIFTREHPNMNSNKCPSQTVLYSTAFASCYKSTWTLDWTTPGIVFGTFVHHEYTINIGKSHPLSYYFALLNAYIASNGITNGSITEKWTECSTECCINEYSYCYDENNQIVRTLVAQHPSTDKCTTDEYCFINPCGE